jgi:hypothetical protein
MLIVLLTTRSYIISSFEPKSPHNKCAINITFANNLHATSHHKNGHHYNQSI